MSGDKWVNKAITQSSVTVSDKLLQANSEQSGEGISSVMWEDLSRK